MISHFISLSLSPTLISLSLHLFPLHLFLCISFTLYFFPSISLPICLLLFLLIFASLSPSPANFSLIHLFLLCSPKLYFHFLLYPCLSSCSFPMFSPFLLLLCPLCFVLFAVLFFLSFPSFFFQSCLSVSPLSSKFPLTCSPSLSVPHNPHPVISLSFCLPFLSSVGYLRSSAKCRRPSGP